MYFSCGILVGRAKADMWEPAGRGQVHQLDANPAGFGTCRLANKIESKKLFFKLKRKKRKRLTKT